MQICQKYSSNMKIRLVVRFSSDFTHQYGFEIDVIQFIEMPITYTIPIVLQFFFSFPFFFSFLFFLLQNFSHSLTHFSYTEATITIETRRKKIPKILFGYLHILLIIYLFVLVCWLDERKCKKFFCGSRVLLM